MKMFGGGGVQQSGIAPSRRSSGNIQSDDKVFGFQVTSNGNFLESNSVRIYNWNIWVYPHPQKEVEFNENPRPEMKW